MGLKIAIVMYKKGPRVCVSNDGLQGKRITKSFKTTEKKLALDYMLTLENQYVDSCCDMVFNFAIHTDHAILWKKNWCFA